MENRDEGCYYSHFYIPYNRKRFSLKKISMIALHVLRLTCTFMETRIKFSNVVNVIGLKRYDISSTSAELGGFLEG